ncbi:MAG: DUF4278 domain-containing protein [Cyanobacteria bacterium]|nr:DUF4278 domain-containing protein [Cyanobacteriota bacterium]
MNTTKLQYRGVPYVASQQENPPSAPVEHIYRGQHYAASLNHEAAPRDPGLEFQYRGHAYHH